MELFAVSFGQGGMDGFAGVFSTRERAEAFAADYVQRMQAKPLPLTFPGNVFSVNIDEPLEWTTGT